MEIKIMENETVYKPIVKKFLGYDVRVVQVDKRNEYIVCKDMFDILGLVVKTEYGVCLNEKC